MPKRVLVADDSVTIQTVVKYSLGQEDVELITVRTAEEAYPKARELRPDLLIVDTVMPGKSGYDLARALRNDPAMGGMPILLLASANEPFDENKARASGADGWLPKPFQSQALIEQVRKLLSTPRAGAPARPASVAPPARPPQPAAARPSVAPPARPAGAPPPVRPSGVVPGARPPPPRPGATVPPPARPAAATRPPPPRPSVVPGARPPPPPGTMPPGARPPAPPAARPAPPAPGPVAAGRGPAPAPAARVTPENHEALLREALTTASRDMLEKVIWEVVPELAETIIREELERLIKARQGQ